MKKVALIGTKGYAALYLDTFLQKHKDKQILLAHIVSIHNHEAAELEAFKKLGIIFHDSLDCFFSKQRAIDLLCIPTSIHSHYDLAVKGLNFGYHIMLEKPAAATTAQIEALMTKSKQLGKKVMVGYQNLFEPETWQIKQRLLSGEIGKIKSAHLIGLWPRSEDYFNRNEWAGKVFVGEEPVFDSVLHNAFAHFLNLIFFWTGNTLNEPNKPIDVQGSLLRANAIESFDTAALHFKTENNIDVFVHLSHASEESYNPQIKLIGEQSNFTWNGFQFSFNSNRTTFAVNSNSGIEKARNVMFDNVLRIMDGENAENCNLELSLPVTKAVELVHCNLEIKNADFTPIVTQHGVQRVISGIGASYLKAFELEAISKM